MLERIVASTLKHRPLVVVVLVFILGIGIYSLLNLHIDAFPDVTNIQVEIVSRAPGLSPLEIEKFVTYPIEMTMRGLPGLQQVRSVVKFGISVVTLVFKDDVDIYFARQQVFQKLVEAEKGMPPGIETEMGPVATAMGELYHYTLEGTSPTDKNQEKQYLTELRTLQDWIVAPLLKNVAGVTEVNSFGGYIKQYQVEVNPASLIKYGLTISDVYEALEKNNENVGGSVIEREFEQSIIRGIGLIRSRADIGSIALEAEQGMPILIKDVARITVEQTLRQGAALKNVREAVGGIVMMLRGENTLDVIRGIREKAVEINHSNILPPGIKIVPYYQRSDIIKSSIRTVTTALLEGALLVLIILFLFLKNIRGALIVIFALPLALLLTFTVMRNTGLDANLMSLGGLAISIGMIIDATIIQVENVHRRLSEKGSSEKDSSESRTATILKAVLEVRKPSIFGELIIALTFIPIVSLQGMEGKMFTPLAFTVAIALLASLLLSIFVIPVLCSFFLKASQGNSHQDTKTQSFDIDESLVPSCLGGKSSHSSPGGARFFGKWQEKESFLLRGAKKVYLPALAWSMKNKWAIIGAAVLLLLVTFIIIPRLGTEFIPIMDEGAFDMDVQMLPGITLDRALEINKQVHHTLLANPEMDTVISRTGQMGIALEGKGVDMTGYTGSYKPKKQRRERHTGPEIVDSLRAKLDEIPGITYGFSQPIQCRIDELVAGTRAQLIIKLFGEEMEILKHKAGEIAAVLSNIKGTTDMIVERTTGQSYIDIQVDRARIARFGLSINDVLRVVEIAVGGKVATQIYEGSRFFDCMVRFPGEERDSIEKLGNIIIRGRQGEMLHRDQLAAIERRPRANQPRKRPKTDRHRVKYPGPGYREFCGGSQEKDCQPGSVTQRLLSILGRSVRKPAAGHETVVIYSAGSSGINFAAALFDFRSAALRNPGIIQFALCHDRGSDGPLFFRALFIGTGIGGVYRSIWGSGTQWFGVGILYSPITPGRAKSP
jgi:cobalt-zinc-cadmium resistance protein CzcA